MRKLLARLRPDKKFLSLEPDLAMLTSGDGSAQSTLGYDGGPAISHQKILTLVVPVLTQLRADAIKDSPPLRMKFRPHDEICVRYTFLICRRIVPRIHSSTSKMTSRSDWTPSLGTRTSWSKVPHQRAFRSAERALARL